LTEDQQALFSEETDRIGILANLDTVHTELLGEHSQDLETTTFLKETQVRIITEISVTREEIEIQTKDLKSAIISVEELLSIVKGDIAKEETHREELQAVVDTPEDINEVGLSEESKVFRAENEELR